MTRGEPDFPRSPAAAAIDAAAAGWLARRVRGLTPRERAEFADWLRSDPRHAPAFAGIDRTWGALDRLKDIRLSDGRRLDADLPPVPADRPQATRRARRGWPAWRERRTLVRGFAPALAAAAALVIAWVGWWQPARARAPFTEMAMTEIGGLKKLPLPDGSVVNLNTASAVEIDYTAAIRRVRLLQGEAHFSVAKNPARPFVVEVSGVDVRAVGTAFNIRLRPAAVEVLVTEGNVRVDAAASGESLIATPIPAKRPLPWLAAGERLVVAVPASIHTTASHGFAPGPEPAAAVAVPAEEIERATAWQARRLKFDATPLAEVVAEFNRYNRHRLVLADARLAGRRFGGTFGADGSDAFVRLLESRFGVKAERFENETRLSLAPGVPDTR